MDIKLQHSGDNNYPSRLMSVVVIGIVILMWVWAPSLALANGAIARASVSSIPFPVEGNGFSGGATFSADGRYVAFSSAATNLVPNDTNGKWDVFVHDRVALTTERVSVSSAEVQADGDSNEGVSLSADGRYVAFASRADNLDPVGAGNLFSPHIYIRDRLNGTTYQIVPELWPIENGASIQPSLSDDGQVVAFLSISTNWDNYGGNAIWKVFVHDRSTGETIRARSSNLTYFINGNSLSVDISGDGKIVTFQSHATNLVLGDTNGLEDVFVYDRALQQVTRIHGNGLSRFPSVNQDGRLIAFSSYANNFVSGDTNLDEDIFVHDRQTGTTTRVSVSSSNGEANGTSRNPQISSDGQYVTFDSNASNLVSGDTNGFHDVFIHDTQTGETTRISEGNGNTQGNSASQHPAISADGQNVTFQSYATNLVSGDTNNNVDVFVHTAPAVALTITPSSASAVLGTGTVQFSATGGDGNYTFEFVDNVSGGTIDMNTGLYTAGSLTTGIDRVQVRDGTGITAEAIITVIDAGFLIPILYLLGC